MSRASSSSAYMVTGTNCGIIKNPQCSNVSTPPFGRDRKVPRQVPFEATSQVLISEESPTSITDTIVGSIQPRRSSLSKTSAKQRAFKSAMKARNSSPKARGGEGGRGGRVGSIDLVTRQLIDISTDSPKDVKRYLMDTSARSLLSPASDFEDDDLDNMNNSGQDFASYEQQGKQGDGSASLKGMMPAPSLQDYGYGEAAPDVASKAATNSHDYYGYGVAEPDVAGNSTGSSSSSSNIDGAANSSNNHVHARMPRKSSMKHSPAMGQQRRRSTISHHGEIEILLPGMKEPVKRRTSICFQETTDIQEVEPVKELTDDPETLWFQDEEYDKIKQRIHKIVDYAESHRNVSPRSSSSKGKPKKAICTRGLERLIDGGERMANRYDSWDSVLDEQYLQRNEGTYDEVGMAFLYSQTSMASKREARRLALQDEKDIASYMSMTRKMYRRQSC